VSAAGPGDGAGPPVAALPDLGSPHLVARLEGRVLHLRIDRTERRNAFTNDMYRALKRAAVWADGQAGLDAVYVTGTGDWFAAGGDMSGASAASDLGSEWDVTDHFPFRHIERCSKLWVAGINGMCVAGGLILALHCDVAVASDRARFRVPELLRGIPDAIMSSRLVEVAGLARARWLMFTAAEIDAPTAEAFGLVGRVVPHDELEAEVGRVLAAIAGTGPAARSAVKRDINRRLPPVDIEMFRRAIGTPEMTEGMRAFLEKRPPEWPRH
jgi:enoyl-CoA hydratase/carnithine racemase